MCALLPDLSPRTRVLILQHPRERRVAVGTATMAARCLRGSRVVVGTRFDAHPAVLEALADPHRRPVLLWPGPDAVDLARDPPAGPITLLVVDGTWHTAKKLLKYNPSIGALPRYAIAPASPSEYRIRREPRAECLSTIEALSTALAALEGEPERYGAMLEPFRAMVGVQLEHLARSLPPRDRSRLLLRKARRKPWALPPALRDPSRVAVVAVESNAWPLGAKDRHPDEIVHWLSARGDESDPSETIVKPTHPPAPSVGSHTGLSPEVLLAGRPREDLRAAVDRCVRAGDAIATWGTYATRMMAEERLAPGVVHVDLRRVAADALHRSPGSIERCVASLGLDPRPLGAGRGGRRLGLMLAVYRALLARAVP